MPSSSRPARIVAAGLLAAASCALLAAGGVALAGVAHAAFVDVPATGQPGRLILSSDPYPVQFLELSPGAPGYWAVDARIEDATSATLALELRKAGELVQHPRGLTMTVDTCPVAWTDLASAPRCDPGARRVVTATPADDFVASSPTFPLQPIAPGDPEHLLVTLAVDDSPAARADSTLMGLEGTMAVGLVAAAVDAPPATPPGVLPATGLSGWPLGAAAAIAAGLLGIGASVRLSRTTAVR